MDYQKALDSEAARKAQDTLSHRFKFSQQRAAEVWDKVRTMVIVDHDVIVDDMHFDVQDAAGATPKYKVTINGAEINLRVHAHALRQMASEVSIPASFVNTLVSSSEAWEWQELVYLLNERFKKSQFKQRSFRRRASFINRTVSDEVRGFVSPSFKIHLATPPLLVEFATACYSFGAMPVAATGSDLSFTFHSALPHVFEPAAGEFIALGCSFSNSDFGAGSMQVKMNVLRLNGGGTSLCVVKPIMSKRHNGAARKDLDEMSSTISNETIEKMIDAAKGQVKDAVIESLSTASVNTFLEVVAKAMTEAISWPRLQNYFAGKLTQDEILSIEAVIEGKRSTTLPPIKHDVSGAPVINLWFASNAVAEIADLLTDDERKSDLMELAGGLLLK